MEAFIQKEGDADQKQEEKAAEGQKPCDSKEKRSFDSGQEPEDILPVKSAFSQV